MNSEAKIFSKIEELVAERDRYEREILYILSGGDWLPRVPVSSDEQKKRNVFFVKNREFKISQIDLQLNLLEKGLG